MAAPDSPVPGLQAAARRDHRAARDAAHAAGI